MKEIPAAAPQKKKRSGTWIAMAFIFWGVLPLTGMMIYLSRTSPRWKNARSGLPQLIVRTFGEKEKNVTLTWRPGIVWAAPRSLVALTLDEAAALIAPIDAKNEKAPDPSKTLLRAELPESLLDIGAAVPEKDLPRVLSAIKAAAEARIARLIAQPTRQKERDADDVADLKRLSAML